MIWTVNYLNSIAGLNFARNRNRKIGAWPALYGEALNPLRLVQEALKSSARNPGRSDVELDSSNRPAFPDQSTGNVNSFGAQVLSETTVGKVSVQFEISHVGTPNDRFYKADTDCDDRSTNMDKDKVYFEVIDDINGNKALCLGLQDNVNNGAAGYVTLYGGKPRTISCTFELGNIESVYEKHITAKMRYRYSQFIEKSIVVEDVSQN